MAVFKTLDALVGAKESANTGGSSRSFLRLNAGDNYKIRFLQELTEDAANFDEDKGTGIVVPVHSAPHDFKKKIACTIDDPEFDYKCWAHEQIPVVNGWKPVQHVLINVAVLDKEENWSAKILDQTFSPKHVVNTLVEYASEYGSITDKYYKISRIGSGMSDTNYQLIPSTEAKQSDEIDALELNDLNSYRKIPYDKQEEFFFSEGKAAASSSDW